LYFALKTRAARIWGPSSSSSSRFINSTSGNSSDIIASPENLKLQDSGNHPHKPSAPNRPRPPSPGPGLTRNTDDSSISSNSRIGTGGSPRLGPVRLPVGGGREARRWRGRGRGQLFVRELVLHANPYTRPSRNTLSLSVFLNVRPPLYDHLCQSQKRRDHARTGLVCVGPGGSGGSGGPGRSGAFARAIESGAERSGAGRYAQNAGLGRGRQYWV
jgi:hypothetical protein